MNLSDLHERLSANKSYRTAYTRIGDAVLVAIHFRAARGLARLTRGELASPLGLATWHVARIEDDFDFSLKQSVSLIADRLEGHLEGLGVNAQAFFVPGGRISDLPAKICPPLKPVSWHPRDFDLVSEGIGNVSERIAEDAVTSDQMLILRRFATGETSQRDAVQELIRKGIIQMQAERLIDLLSMSDEEHRALKA